MYYIYRGAIYMYLVVGRRARIDHLKDFTLKYNKLPTETEIQKTVLIPDLDSRQKVVLHSSNRKANKV